MKQQYPCKRLFSVRHRVIHLCLIVMFILSAVFYNIGRIIRTAEDEVTSRGSIVISLSQEDQEPKLNLVSLGADESNVALATERDDVDGTRRTHGAGPLKTILVWNGFLRRVEVSSFGFAKDSFAKQGCQYSQCQLIPNNGSTEMKSLDSYDAILVNFNDQKAQLFLGPLPNRTRHDQVFIFFTQEPPPSLAPLYNLSALEGHFNWTMTYRTDSDVPLLYGRILPSFTSSPSRDINMDAIIRNKTRSVAWMVTNCKTHSHRELYVQELAKYIDVDIYGKCGNLSCPRHPTHSSDPKCYDMIEAKYKFYLSFENALCRDYVTEKLYKVLDHVVVPVVYGGVDYSRAAPPHSYIDARKFAGPKELADYLKILSDNEDLYREYFKWKEDFVVEAYLEDRVRRGFCDLCKKLHHQDSGTEPVKSHWNLSAAWDVDSQCINPSI